MTAAAVHVGGIADHIHPEPQGFIRRYVFSLDHKIIGIQYIITAFVFFVLGGLLAEVIRTQLLNANGGFVSPNTYDEVYSIHGSVMVWLVIIPMVTGGFGNFVMPLQIGARDVAFPWLNMLSFWLVPVGRSDAVQLVSRRRADAGWTEYPPVSLQGGAGTRCGAAAIFIVGIGSTMTGTELYGDDLQDARAGDDLDADAAVQLGDVRDRAAQHDRDGRALRGACCALPGATCSTCRSSIRRAAAARSSTSTCSGSTRIRRSTSSSCRPSG